MKKKILSVILVVLGFGLVFYPWISNYIFVNRTDSIVNAYEKKSQHTSVKEKEKMLELAREYNRQLKQAKVEITDPFKETQPGQITSDYYNILKIDEAGLIGSIEIPCIKVKLPIYHGTSSSTLMKGAGHIEGTSFPIGGKSTHAVISAHSGLNSAKMFTDITKMRKEDLFYIHVLNDVYAYKVVSINTILPNDTELLQIQENEDLVTLMTCTPYGVNSHRLLVTGERTEYSPEKYEAEQKKDETGDSEWKKQYLKAIITGLIIVFIITILLFIKKFRKNRGVNN